MAKVKKVDETEEKELDTDPLKKNYVVRTEIQRLSKKTSHSGRKKKFTRTTMRNGINRYFQWCEEKDRVPSIKGLMLQLKMSRDQFYTYAEYPEFTEMMDATRQIILEWCENDIYRTPGPAAGKIAYMKNVHDWTEKIDQTQSITTRKVLSVEDARGKIASLAPLLLEVLQGQTLAQIGHTQKVIEAEPMEVTSE